MRIRKDGEVDRRSLRTGKRGHTRTPFVLNSVVYRDEQAKERIDWTCPKCGHRNIGIRWYGREEHWCFGCSESTDLKGPTVSAEAVATLPVQ